jgi:hypothetical protein
MLCLPCSRSRVSLGWVVRVAVPCWDGWALVRRLFVDEDEGGAAGQFVGRLVTKWAPGLESPWRPYGGGWNGKAGRLGLADAK